MAAAVGGERIPETCGVVDACAQRGTKKPRRKSAATVSRMRYIGWRSCSVAVRQVRASGRMDPRERSSTDTLSAQKRPWRIIRTMLMRPGGVGQKHTRARNRLCK